LILLAPDRAKPQKSTRNCRTWELYSKNQSVAGNISVKPADKASDDGSGILSSKSTIQRHTELGESTVKRTITDFLREGILIETGRRPSKNGFTVIYRIVLDRVIALESAAEPYEGTRSRVDLKPP